MLPGKNYFTNYPFKKGQYGQFSNRPQRPQKEMTPII